MFGAIQDELISDVFQRTHTHGLTSIVLPAKTYIRLVWTLDAGLRNCWEQQTIGADGERESNDSLLLSRFDDDDDDDDGGGTSGVYCQEAR